MIFFHGLRLYRLAAAEADMSYTPPFGGAIFFSMVRMIELLLLLSRFPLYRNIVIPNLRKEGFGTEFLFNDMGYFYSDSLQKSSR